ncbi:MAG: DUF3990 domain-containing protein [Hespellia sp.]|nr:DUF3990 domain-containing protein [Hespellia sp.]
MTNHINIPDEPYRLLFHGSNQKVNDVKLLESGFTKDFGYGFYLTEIATQAEKWARTKARRKGSPMLNVYYFYEKAYHELKILRFPEMTEEWLDFIVACRNGKKHDYDIVEGPMANDEIYNYITEYLNGTISRADFWTLIKFRYPTHQLVLCTKKAMEYIRFKESRAVNG